VVAALSVRIPSLRRTVMDINDCKRTDLHNHASEEEDSVWAMSEYWGWVHADEFIVTHCDPKARDRFVKQWGQQPAADFESISQQLDNLTAARERDEDNAWLEVQTEAERVEDWFVEKERAAAQRRGLTLEEFRQQRWESTEWRQTVKSLAEANASGHFGPRVLALLGSVGHRDWEVINERIIR
jgi:hypothetical protein